MNFLRKYKPRETCRSCGYKLEFIYSLGDLAISGFTDKPQNGKKYPLDLAECMECGLLQLRHTAPADVLYKSQYWYKSSVNPAIVSDLKKIAKKYKEGGVWIDIGANDGTLLKYVSKKYEKIGVEPAKNLRKELSKYAKAVTKLWEDVNEKEADVITAIGMLYDSENPNIFIDNVRKHLKPKGVFIAQLMTLAPMLRLNDVSNVCHEHLEFYSYKSLVDLFERNKLEIYRVEENKINGGSYRLYARHYKKGSVDYLEPKANYPKFVRSIEGNRKKTVDFIAKEVRKGKKVYAYGASTKGNTILQWYGLEGLIEGVADRNPKKWGKYTVATKIPVVSEAEARKNADYFFILPYGFTKDFIKRESSWAKKGGKFIVSIPEFQVYG